MDENPVLVEKREGYRVITLNRPQRLNAFNEPMQQALVAAVAAAETDENCRALLLTGTGRAFSSGQDLSERINAAGEVTLPGAALEQYYNPLVRKLRALPFPVVCAVNGTAAGVSCKWSSRRLPSPIGRPPAIWMIETLSSGMAARNP